VALSFRLVRQVNQFDGQQAQDIQACSRQARKALEVEGKPGAGLVMNQRCRWSVSRFQETDKAGLLEVMVGGQGLQNAVLLHQKETHRIAQRPVLVQTLPQELESIAVERLRHVDELDGRVVLQIGDERQCGLPGEPLAFARATNSART
jgi:hypothetical protein